MAVWSLRNDGYCWGKARCCEGLRADALKKKSRVYPLRDGFCALRARGLFFFWFWPSARRTAGHIFAVVGYVFDVRAVRHNVAWIQPQISFFG